MDMGRARTHRPDGSGRKAVPGAAEAERRWQQAVAAYQQGRLADARRAVKPLVDLPGAPGEVALLAGLVEARLGRPEQAEGLLERGLQSAPERIEGWLGLGNVRTLLGRPAEAATAFQKVLARAPQHPAALNNLGVSYEERWRHAEALDCYERALAADPNFEDALRGRARALVRLRRTEDAEAAYRDLLARHPDDPALSLDLAELLERANRPGDAAGHIPPGDALSQPELVARSRGLEAQLMIRNGEPEPALELLRRTRRESGCDSLSYREGTVLDSLGRTDEAMEAFRRANAARAREGRFRRLRRSDLAEYLDAKLARDPVIAPVTAPPAPAGPSPVFIVGLPRSGTTLLDRMLAAHPDIQIFEEIEGLRAAELALDRGADDGDARAAYWTETRHRIAVDDDRLHVDKHPMNAMHLDVIARLFPDAVVIYALRHPFDAALSCYMQDFVANVVNVHFLELESTGALLGRLLELMRRFETAAPGRVVRVRYEHLVANQRAEITRVLEALGLEWDERIADFAAHAASSGLIGTASYAQVSRGLYRDAVERWRRYAQWLAPLEASLGPKLGHFGYEM